MLKRLFLLFCFAASTCVPGTSQSSVSHQRLEILPVRFINADLLSERKRNEMSQAIRGKTGFLPLDGDPATRCEEAQEQVRAAYQDKGYMNVETVSRHQVISRSGHRALEIAVTVKALGSQYIIRDMQFTGMSEVPEERLRELMPIRPGMMLKRSPVRQGLEAWRRLYLAKGHIDFSAIPQIEFDEETKGAWLTFNIDEGEEFHFGDLHLALLDDRVSRELQQGWSSLKGGVYSEEALNKFFQHYFRFPSPNISSFDYTWTKFDFYERTADVFMTFVPAPTE